MLSIGKEIENKLREALDETLLEIQYRRKDEKMMAGDVQNGQDIIVRYQGKDIYYVEVKSKWNFDEPAHMSVNQMRQAVLNSNNYALCCVDLSNFSIFEVDTIPIEVIMKHCYIHLNIGQKLSDLIGPIVKDVSDADTHIKISDYRCDLNKGFFTSSLYVGIEPLINDIVRKASV